MGILDKVFSGQKGIVNVLAGKLGGKATIVYITQEHYNKETDSYTETNTTAEVNFIPVAGTEIVKTSYPSTNGGFSMSGGIQRENEDLAGTIPSSELDVMPEPNRDRIRYYGTEFYLTSIKTNYVGNTAISYYITAKK